jgi:hypothetical protein
MAAIDFPLPRSVWPYWLLAAAVVAGFPITSFVYYPALLGTGTLPPDGDSIAIPMFGSVIVAVVSAPGVLLLTYMCLRKYKPGGTVLIWRRDRPVSSIILTLCFGVPVVALIAFAVQDAFAPYPLVESISTPYGLICVVWLMALRAAALSRRGNSLVDHF